MFTRDLDAQRFRLQPIAVAGFAGHVGEVFCQFLTRPLTLGLAKAAVDIGDHALERLLGIVGAHAVFIGELDLVVARAMQDRVLRLLRQVLPFGVERELVEFSERGQCLHVIRRRRLRPRRDRALAQGQFLVGNDEIFIDMLFDAEPAAGRAGAVGVVERKQPRLDFGNGESGNRAGEFFRKQDALRAALVVDLGGLLLVFGRRSRGGCIRIFDHREAFRDLQRGLETLRQPLTDIRPHHDAINDQPRRCRAGISCREQALRRAHGTCRRS